VLVLEIPRGRFRHNLDDPARDEREPEFVSYSTWTAVLMSSHFSRTFRTTDDDTFGSGLAAKIL
jgi:hypothetical protein